MKQTTPVLALARTVGVNIQDLTSLNVVSSSSMYLQPQIGLYSGLVLY